MKITKELRNLSLKERGKRLSELKKEHLKMRVQVMSGGSAANPGKLRQIRKNIARLLTLEKESVKVSSVGVNDN